MEGVEAEDKTLSESLGQQLLSSPGKGELALLRQVPGRRHLPTPGGFWSRPMAGPNPA